jgi:hypothetical protein
MQNKNDLISESEYQEKRADVMKAWQTRADSGMESQEDDDE